jgi:signal transduction histidine kinase
MPIVTLPASIVPFDDEERLKKLYLYDILDTSPEDAFDKIAILASQIFDTPNAFVTFVDRDRVFFKSNISFIEGNEVDRKESLCAIAILQQQTTIINDTQEIPYLSGKDFVEMEGGIRFYAGAPLTTLEGFRMGTVCVTDSVPREVTAKQMQMLETLASIVMDELDTRLRTRKNVRVQTDLLNITVHDLKSPLSAVRLFGHLVNERSTESPIKELAAKITRSTDNILNTLNDLLNLSKIENGDVKISRDRIDVCQLLEKVKDTLDVLAHQKNQKITIHKTSSIIIHLDDSRIHDVFENLLSNAIKYSYPKTNINIFVTRTEENVLIEFRDEGQGLSETDMEKLFVRYAKLSAIPTGKERSNGLGLSIVKTLVELHNGMVWAESAGKGKGSSFFVSLPLTLK